MTMSKGLQRKGDLELARRGRRILILEGLAAAVHGSIESFGTARRETIERRDGLLCLRPKGTAEVEAIFGRSNA